ncbi:MAG: methionine--tRNA ligase [Patescibacteria group bacterium]
MITIDDFAKVEIRVGLVVNSTNKEGSEKLIKLVVDFGDEQRTIFTGIRTYGFTPEDFLNKKFLFVTNLEYRKMIDEESQGMILAVGDEKPIFVSAENLPVGSKVR